MTQEDIIKIFVGNQFKQFCLYSFVHDETNKKITLNLHRHENMPYTCCKCGQQCLFAYDSLNSREVEDLPVTDLRLFYRFTPVRIYCPYCKTVHVEQIDGLSPHSRQTDRFKLFIARKCESTSVSAVAIEYHLNDDTVRRIDKEYLQK